MLRFFRSKERELDQETINVVSEIGKKNPTYALFFEGLAKKDLKATPEIIKDTYKLAIRYKELLRRNEFDVFSFERAESLYDAITELALNNEKRRYAKSFISNKYEHLLSDRAIDLFFVAKGFGLNKADVNNVIMRKAAKFENPSDLEKSISQFIEASKATIESKVAEIEKAGAKVAYQSNEDKILIARIPSYTAAKNLGVSSWCICTSKSIFESYTERGAFQFFVWDFGKEISDREYLLGVTISFFGTKKSAHWQDDRYARTPKIKLVESLVPERTFDEALEQYQKDRDTDKNYSYHGMKMTDWLSSDRNISSYEWALKNADKLEGREPGALPLAIWKNIFCSENSSMESLILTRDDEERFASAIEEMGSPGFKRQLRRFLQRMVIKGDGKVKRSVWELFLKVVNSKEYPIGCREIVNEELLNDRIFIKQYVKEQNNIKISCNKATALIALMNTFMLDSPSIQSGIEDFESEFDFKARDLLSDPELEHLIENWFSNFFGFRYVDELIEKIYGILSLGFRGSNEILWRLAQTNESTHSKFVENIEIFESGKGEVVLHWLCLGFNKIFENKFINGGEYNKRLGYVLKLLCLFKKRGLNLPREIEKNIAKSVLQKECELTKDEIKILLSGFSKDKILEGLLGGDSGFSDGLKIVVDTIQGRKIDAESRLSPELEYDWI